MKNSHSSKVLNSLNAQIFAIALGVMFIHTLPAHSQETASACGALQVSGQYGPWDYRTDSDKLPIVLDNHFTPEVEALVRGRTSTTAGRDIDYTLRAIPNNHRALIAMMRLGEKEKTENPSGSRYTVECWFVRAIQFRPDDGIVRMIYSTYLNKNGRTADASSQLAIATTYAKDNSFTHYNIGLHQFNLKNYDKALIQAHKALELGFTQTALREKLQSVGKWKEPVDKQATPAAANEASSPPVNATSTPVQ